MHDQLSLIRQAAATAAAAARKITLSYFLQPLDIETKADESPVTKADQETEAAIMDVLKERFPDHGFLGEETGTKNLDKEFVWVVDPIDGTRAFIAGVPLWGTLIACCYQGYPVFGLVDLPAIDRCWVAAQGQGCCMNGQVCQVTQSQTLDQVFAFATTPDMFDEVERPVFDRVSLACKDRRFGGDCLSYGLLASGHAGLVMEANLGTYDYMAPAVIVQEAGGLISDWQGQALTLASGSQVLATANAGLQSQALDLIKS